MSAPVTDAVALHPVEVDLLCTLAEVGAPFPLQVPSFGTTHAERQRIFGVARAELAARGLAGERGPTGTAATFVRMLRAGAGTIDIVVAADGRSQGAVALVDGPHALLLTQSPDDPDRTVGMAEMHTDTAVRELLALVPAVPSGDVPAFTVPLPPVRQVFDRLDRHRRIAVARSIEPDPLSDSDIDGLLWESGVDDRTASRLVTTMRQVTGSGQLGATCWQAVPGRWQRLGTEVHWVDTAHGRFRIGESADGLWASVNPCSRNDVRAELRKLAAMQRHAGDDETGWSDRP